MKKKLIKFLAIPLSVFVICLFTIPAYLFADLGEDMADALDIPEADGDFTATDENDQGDTFSSFGNIAPNEGDDFVFMSTGDAQDNKSGADDSTDFNGDDPDWANLEIDNLVVPSGVNGFTFDLYYITDEDPGSEYDYFEATLWNSTATADGTVIAYVDADDVSQENYDLDGTAFENDNSSGGGTAGGPVNPGDNIEINFYLTDTLDGIVDSAVILDNFQWSGDSVCPGVEWGTEFKKKKKKKAVAPPPPPVRTNPMTCAWVGVTENPGHFAFIFWYEYENNNWVQIFDMDGNLVWQIDFPKGEPYFEADLPDGTYKVQTFHEAGKILQEFIIGK
jgi:hypothetical protein